VPDRLTPQLRREVRLRNRGNAGSFTVRTGSENRPLEQMISLAPVKNVRSHWAITPRARWNTCCGDGMVRPARLVDAAARYWRALSDCRFSSTC